MVWVVFVILTETFDCMSHELLLVAQVKTHKLLSGSKGVNWEVAVPTELLLL